MIGARIDGRFVVEREAASGGMGRIFEARDSQSGRRVALKQIASGDPAASVRFQRESVILAELRHPGVVEYVAHGRLPDGSPYLAMEWLEGRDLASYLADAERSRGLPIAEVLQLARRLASTLAAVHACGVIHRDLKPGNLFLPGGDTARVKLIDFGAAREIADSVPLTRQGQVIGTPYYMAPEQVRGDEICPAADVWALGCVLYECLTGRPPFAASRPLGAMIRVMVDEPTAVAAVRSGIPDRLCALIGAMLAKEPAARPASGDSLVRALAAIEAGSEPATGERSLADTVAPPGRATTRLDMSNERRVRALLFGRLADPDAGLAELRRLAAHHGATIESLADGSGSLIITHSAGDSPTDQAVRGALLALALRASARDLALVLATGHASAADRLPVGQIVDQAVASLQSAWPGEIRVDRVTASLLEGRFEVDVDDARCLVVRRRAIEESRTLLGKPSRWVGRRRELAGVLAAYDECVENSVARAMLITAPAGIGKSRLCSEVLRALASRGDDVEVLRGQGDSLGAGSPFVMIAPAIRRSAGIFDGEPLAQRRDKLLARLGWSLPGDELARIAGFIGELVGVPFPDHHSESLRAARSDPMLLAELTRRAFCELIRAECALRPVILVLDDLHWGDAPSIAFVDAALRTADDCPFLVLALARPEVHNAFPRLWQSRELEELRLHALPAKACAEIVRASLGDDVPDDRLDELVARSEGNAFYLEEVVRAAADGSVATLPDSVIGMVQARLSGLDPEARRLLRAASVFGEVFWEGGVRALITAADAAFDVAEWLGELVRLELVNRQEESRLPGEREYRFRHSLLREGAYDMLVDRDRVLGHLAAGEWLAGAGEPDALILAGHFERGDDRDRAISWLRRAADQALEANDLAAAIDRAERAVSAGAAGETLGGLRGVQATAAFWLARYRESADRGEAAADLLPEGSTDWFRAVASAMISSARLGDSVRFERLLRRAELAPDGGAVHVVCLSRAAYQLILGGSLERADRTIARIDAMIAAGAVLDQLAIAHLSDACAAREAAFGHWPVGIQHCERAAEAYRRAGDLHNACASQITIAFLTGRLGDLARAETLYRERLDEAVRLGSGQALAMAKFGLSWVLSLRSDDLTEARAMLDEAVAMFRGAGHARFDGWLTGALADLAHRSGDHPASLEHALVAVERLTASPSLLSWALALEARALLALGRTTEALETAKRSMALLDELGALLWGEELPPLVLAEVLRGGGDHAAACAAIRDARDRLLRRVATLEGTPWRETYVTPADAARTLQLAAEWLDS